MLRTLFFIPNEVAGVPLFPLLLVVWCLFGVLFVGWLLWRQGPTSDTWSYVPLFVLIGAVIYWLLPALCEPAGLPIRSYGVMLLLAVLAGTGLALWRARRMGIDADLVISMVFWMFVPGIIGARAFYVIEYWANYRHDTLRETLLAVLNVAQGGLVVYGSFIGGLAGLIVFVVRYRLSFLVMGDLFAPSFMLGLALGRLGCMLNGCCFGGTCDVPWAVTFPWSSPPHTHQVEHGMVFVHGLKLQPQAPNGVVIAEVQPDSSAAAAGLAPGQRILKINDLPVRSPLQALSLLVQIEEPGTAVTIATGPPAENHRFTVSGPMPRSLPVHPAQLYGSVNGLLLCLLLLAYDPFRKRDGELVALTLTIYPVCRFLLEIIRVDESAVFGTEMSISQNVSLGVFLAGLILWGVLRTRPRGVTCVCPASPAQHP